MAPSKENNPKEKPSSFFTSSSKFYPAISTMAVAQICLTAGFDSAESSALRSLSDITGLYFQTLARSAAFAANGRGRTQSNLLDVIRAMEEASVHRGFAGASNPARPLLESSVVRDSMTFVESMEEVPFPKPIRRRRDAAADESGVRVPAWEEGTWNHVPAWLPGFPEWRREERTNVREKERLRWEELIELGSDGEPGGEIGVMLPATAKDLPAERERVRFKIGLLGKRRKMRFLLENGGDDDDEEKGGSKNEKRFDNSSKTKRTKNKSVNLVSNF